jgi:conjugal transfer pilus assembly protein TraU
MKALFRLILVLAAALWLPATSHAQQICNGKFPNLITDICYDCIFPIGIMGGLLNLGVSGDDYDTGASKTPICVCTNNLSIGTPVSFWEPRYMIDTTTKPGCMPLLAGVDINTPYNAAEYGGINTTNAHIGGRRKSAFMHVNEYINPVMSAIGAVVANPCLDNRSFDVPFLSWADPTWNDDALSLILTPYAYPFAGVASVAAELPDSIAATFGFPYATLFWVAGAWGPMYPLTGNVAVANSQEQVSHLMIARLFAKLHAAGTQQSTAGQDALGSCGALGLPQLVMDKRQYKTNRVFPFPDNLCTPIGRPLAFQEMGASRPQDKDYGYFIFQRKDCCATMTLAN